MCGPKALHFYHIWPLGQNFFMAVKRYLKSFWNLVFLMDFWYFSKITCMKCGQNLAKGQFWHLRCFCSSGQTCFWPKETLYRWFWLLAKHLLKWQASSWILKKILHFWQHFVILSKANLATCWPMIIFLAKYGQKWKQGWCFGQGNHFRVVKHNFGQHLSRGMFCLWNQWK